jgi:hypothetical protein
VAESKTGRLRGKRIIGEEEDDNDPRRGVRRKNKWQNEERQISKKAKKVQKAQLKKINFLDVFSSAFLLWKTGRVIEKGVVGCWFFSSLVSVLPSGS